MKSLDALRLAAIAYTRASDKLTALQQFGAGVGPAREEMARATRQLITAGDVHGARVRDGLCDLIRSGHTIDSAKRTIKMRGDGRGESAVRRKFVKPAPAAGRRKR